LILLCTDGVKLVCAGPLPGGLFIFDYPSLTWTDTSSSVGGKTPLANVYLNIAVVGGKVYLFGGANEDGITSKHAATSGKCDAEDSI
jgi:hypothetical protein